MTVEQEIDRATTFGQQLEDIIVNRGAFTLSEAADREKLLLAYWALVFDLDKGILNLIRAKFYGGAFALLRPVVEAEIRAHVVLIGSDDIVARIKDDSYTTNFKAVGAEIDAAYNLAGFFDKFLNGTRGALHSFTHSGLSQLGRRFKGNDLESHYEDGEIIEVIHTASAAVFLVTNLVTHRFKFEDEAKKVSEMFIALGNSELP